MIPVNIAKDFTNKTYISDVTIRFRSGGFSGNFKLEYFPGTLNFQWYSPSHNHYIGFHGDKALYENQFIFIGPLAYERKPKNWCKPKLISKKFESYLEAKEACSIDRKCKMFYDFRGRGYYYQCGYSSSIKWSESGSILYDKNKSMCVISFPYCKNTILW